MEVTFSSVDGVIGEMIGKTMNETFIEINPGRIYLPKKYPELYEEIRDLPIRKDDVWMLSFPRTGSTRAQELIWLLGNKLDFEGAKQVIIKRAPFLELVDLFRDYQTPVIMSSVGKSGLDFLRNSPPPRFPRSHFHWLILPQGIKDVKPKLIYTARNPKDVCVSFYHYLKLAHQMDMTLDEFCELFVTEKTPFGSYLGHVLAIWERRNDSNILFLKYEDMSRDFPATIRKCAEFLEIDYDLTEDKIDQICEHFKFEKMQQNPAINLKSIIISQEDDPNSNARFIRKGQIGDWKNHLSTEMSRKIDEWTELKTKGTGLVFDYE